MSLVLTCRSEAPAWQGADLSLRPAPHINRGFEERGIYYLAKSHASAQLFVDDEPLQEADGEWLWRPGFYAGTVTAELLLDGVSHLFLLRVEPAAWKVDGDVFEQMMREILHSAPELLVGNEPGQMSVGGRGAHDDCRIQFMLLKRYGQSFCRALDAIAARPLSELSWARQFVPLNAIRRADRQTVLSALKSPALSAIAAGAWDRADCRVDVPEPRPHYDGAANRCIVSAALAVRRRIAQVHAGMEDLSRRAPDSDTRTGLAARWPKRSLALAELRRSLDACLKRRPFSLVSRPEVSSAGLNAVSADPAYARAHKLAWKILSARIDEDIGEESLWLSPTWEIFERWCFVRLGRNLREHLVGAAWARQPRHPSGAAVALCGVASDGQRYELLLQPVFPAGDRAPRGGFQSTSGERCPDIVLTRSGPDGERFIILDAKYRTKREGVLDAMTSAHVYLDCLRWHGKRASRSLLLVPRAGGAAWLEDTDFHARERCGVLELSFASSDPPIGEWIRL